MKRLLIIKIGAIGDVVMALPIITAIRKEYPSCQIDWICSETISPILEIVDDKYLTVYKVNDKKLFTGTIIEKMQQLLSIWKRVGLRRYDRVVIPNYDWRYRLISLPVISPEKLINSNKKRPCPIKGRHRSSENVRMSLGLKDNGPIDKWPEYPTFKLGQCTNVEILNLSQNAYLTLIGLAPGGAKNLLRDDGLRRWPIENYVSLAKKLIEDKFKVILIGGPADQWILPHFKDLEVINFVGKTSLIDLLQLLRVCKLLITHDCGPLHLADLVGTPSVSIFGPTDPHWFIPIAAQSNYLWGGAKLACRPCYDDNSYAKCSDNLCMKEIVPETVLQIGIEILKSI